jgi:hypothetical protein
MHITSNYAKVLGSLAPTSKVCTEDTLVYFIAGNKSRNVETLNCTTLLQIHEKRLIIPK